RGYQCPRRGLPVVLPRVTAIAATVISAEEHGATAPAVVGHGVLVTCGGTASRSYLGPGCGRAVVLPGVAEHEAAARAAVSSEENGPPARAVVRHRVLLASDWAAGRGHLGPGCSCPVVLPRTSEIGAVDSTEENRPPARAVVRHRMKASRGGISGRPHHCPGRGRPVVLPGIDGSDGSGA